MDRQIRNATVVWQIKSIGVVAFAAMLLAAPTYAQDSDASLRGQVSAAQLTPDMRVLARSEDSGYRREVAVTADGSYLFPSLQIGRYRLELLAADGTVLGSRNITLQVGQDAVLSLAPDQGDAVEEIVVFGEEIKTVPGAAVGSNISLEQIESLPQNSRNFLAFADLAPGVSFERGSNGATRIQGGAQGSNSVNVFIDGVGQKDYVLKNGITGQDSSQGNPFPQMAIAEYRVITQNYKAEFDQVSSAAITAVTQSGTNEFRGNAFWDYTDDGFRSRTPREIELGENKVQTEDNQFGIAFGGPIMRDRLHFFAAYEGKRNEVPVEVNPGGDVSPADFPSEYQDQFGVFSRRFEQDMVFGKLDFFPSDLDLIQFSVKVRKETGLRWDNGPNAPSYVHDINNDETRVMFRYERNGLNWINDVRLTYEDSAWNPQPDAGIARLLHLSGGVGGVNRIFNSGGHPNFQDKGQEGLGIQNDFTWIGFDKHTIKAGFKIKAVELTATQQQPFNPEYYYNVEFDPNGTTAFNDQVPHRVDIGAPLEGIGNGTAISDNVQYGLYVQDDWQATDRLELSLGIRWDYEETPVYLDHVTPADALVALSSWPGAQNANYDLGEFVATGNNRSAFDDAFAPRFGFSFLFNDTFTLFGGLGRSYDRTQFDFVRAESAANTFRTFQFDFDTGDPGFQCSNCPAWDPVYLTEEGRSQLLTGETAAGGRQVFLLNNDLRMPYSDQFSFGLRGFWDTFDGEIGVTRIEARDGFAWLLGNRQDNGSFFVDGDIWGAPFGFSPPGFGNLLLGVNGLESNADSIYLKAGMPYNDARGWGINATYTYTDAEENRRFGQTFSLDFPTLDDYPVLTSAGVSKHRLVATGSVDLPWGLRLSGKLTYRSPVYQYGIGWPGDADGQRAPRVAKVADDFQQVDLALVKYFDVGSPVGADRGRFRIRADIINVFDHANLTNFVGDGRSEEFAQPATRSIGGNFPRLIKLSIGYDF